MFCKVMQRNFRYFDFEQKLTLATNKSPFSMLFITLISNKLYKIQPRATSQRRIIHEHTRKNQKSREQKSQKPKAKSQNLKFKKALKSVPFIAIFRQAFHMHQRGTYCSASSGLYRHLSICGCGEFHHLKGTLNFQKAYHAPVSSPCSSLCQLPTAWDTIYNVNCDRNLNLSDYGQMLA